MKKSFLLIMGILCTVASLHAQSPPKIKPLTIGDSMPDVQLGNVLHYTRREAHISDFKGKAVILDFFATWCGSCIAALPRLDSLQTQFEKNLQILIIDYESTDKVNAFIQHNPIGKTVSLPFIAADSTLDKYFPHKLIPHEVWINKSGEVAAITGANYVTVDDIQSLIAGKPLNWPVKMDVMEFDQNKPLLENGCI